MANLRARQHLALSTLRLPAGFSRQTAAWRQRWLQHYTDCPHVLRAGLTVTVFNHYAGIGSHPYTLVVIAADTDHVWIRSGGRPFPMLKSRFKFYYFNAHHIHHDAIWLTPAEQSCLKAVQL